MGREDGSEGRTGDGQQRKGDLHALEGAGPRNFCGDGPWRALEMSARGSRRSVGEGARGSRRSAGEGTRGAEAGAGAGAEGERRRCTGSMDSMRSSPSRVLRSLAASGRAQTRRPI